MTATYTSTNAFGLEAGREVYEYVDGDLVPDDLQELVTMSLFTWRRALDGDQLPDEASRQGWYGDAEFGSRLWLLNYQRLDTAALANAKTYVLEALQWMIDDGIISAVAVETERGARGIYLDIRLQAPRAPEARLRYAYLTEGV